MINADFFVRSSGSKRSKKEALAKIRKEINQLYYLFYIGKDFYGNEWGWKSCDLRDPARERDAAVFIHDAPLVYKSALTGEPLEDEGAQAMNYVYLHIKEIGLAGYMEEKGLF